MATAAPSVTPENEPPLIDPFNAFKDHSWGWESSEQGISSFMLIFSVLLALCLILCKALHHLKHVSENPKHEEYAKWKYAVATFIPEAGAVILVGVVASFFLSLGKLVNNGEGGGGDVDGGGIPESNSTTTDDASIENEIEVALTSFSSNVFFLLLLPPIIFNSGYHLNRKLFFPLLVPIICYAIIGTTISTVLIALTLQGAVSMGLAGGFAPTIAELLAFGGLISAADPYLFA